MANKLTCKMSDGTEWEAEETGECACVHDCGGVIFIMKPIKRAPREGWAIVHRKADSFCYNTREEAQRDLDMQFDASCYEIIKLREVVE